MSDYTKWPRLLVRGENVTPGRAEEMILRTTDWGGLFSNDKTFLASVYQAVGFRPQPDYSELLDVKLAWWKEADALADQFGGRVKLHYLGLGSRIVSAWIGGPHGWLDWDGTVGCSNYNIGKWPSQEAIEEDLATLAGAFPWLSADFQLVTDEGEGEVADTWSMDDGSWHRWSHNARLTVPTDPPLAAMLLSIQMGSGVREHGTTPLALKAAADRLRARGGAS